MELRRDAERLNDPKYIKELEQFKAEEKIKEKYKKVFGMDDKHAEMAKNAEIAGDNDLLQRVFKLAKGTTTTAPAAEPDPEPEKDDFIIGWENPNDPPHRQKQTRQAQEATTDTDDPFLEGWEKGATGV